MDLLEFLQQLDSFNVAIAIGIGAVMSALMNLTGVGGGVMVIPVLAVSFPMSPVMLVGTASMYVTVSKIISSISHIRSGSVDWHSSRYFLLGAIPTVLLTTYAIVSFINTSPEYNLVVQKTIYYLSVAFIILAGISMLHRQTTNQQRRNRHTALVLCGVGVGMVMGATGIGGGVLIIPALTAFTKLSIKQVVSGSLVIAVVLSGLTGLVYSQSGQLQLSVLTGMLMGSLIGVYASEWFRHKLPDELLKRIIIGIILLAAMIMLVRGAPIV